MAADRDEKTAEGTVRRIYLDNNATTPVDPRVFKAMRPFLEEDFGNASSLHVYGQAARKAVEDARERVAALIGASSEEIYFTSGGTESDNWALRGVTAASEKETLHLITSTIEHPAVLRTSEQLEREGYRVSFVSVDRDGKVSLDELSTAVNEQTVLISVMLANHEVGTIQPLGEIVKIGREHGIAVHTDAVQAVGKIPVDVGKLEVDLLSISSHKIHGPKGVGALYIRKGTEIVPLITGGGQERTMRAGTENVPGIVGFGEACRLAREELGEREARVALLRDRLAAGIRERIPHVRFNGHQTDRLPGTLSVSFEHVEGEAIVLSLDNEGIAVSSGSACASGSSEPSPVLLAMGLGSELAQGSIRFSLGKDNLEEEVDRVLDVLPRIVERLRAMSPRAR